MISDWCDIKDHKERILMIRNVQYSHKIYVFFNIVYLCGFWAYFLVFLQSYFNESVENRKLVLPSNFPFPSQISPIFEVLSFIQFFMLMISGIGCAVIDSLFLGMVIILNKKYESVSKHKNLSPDFNLNNYLKSIYD